LSASGCKPAASAPPGGRAQREDAEREASAGGGVPLMGTEWRRISGSTSGEGCADAPPGAEAEGGSFSARRPTAVFDSWRKYAPSLAARRPARKLMDGGALGRGFFRRARAIDRAGVVCGEVWIWVFDSSPIEKGGGGVWVLL